MLSATAAVDPEGCEHPDCAHYADQKFLGRHLCGDHYTEMLDERFSRDEQEEFMRVRELADACHLPCY